MTDSAYGTGSEPLTVDERARLRLSVRVEALERWLAATGGEARRSVIAHFAVEVTADDIRASYVELASSDESLAELNQTLEEPLPSEGPVHEPGPDAPPGAVAYTVIPHEDFIIQVTPPDDAALRALWDDIEPVDGA
jgi:hypothetical protein